MERAVSDFLLACGLDPADPNLADTPRRVTAAWADEFLDGYRTSPGTVLSERFPVARPAERELVVVTGLAYRSMCPHHLLPYAGRAHVAYVPGTEVVGFGKLASLVSALSHRLVLQETLAQSIAAALLTELGSQGAACVLEAEQTCLRLRGEEQAHAVTHAEAYEGVLKEPALRAELWNRLKGA